MTTSMRLRRPRHTAARSAGAAGRLLLECAVYPLIVLSTDPVRSGSKAGLVASPVSSPPGGVPHAAPFHLKLETAPYLSISWELYRMKNGTVLLRSVEPRGTGAFVQRGSGHRPLHSRPRGALEK
jgi:hypothetical protein